MSISKPQKSIIFNKYRIKKLIAKTHFGWLYEGINIKENQSVALKIEKKISKFNLLESEAYMLYYLKGFGIPKLISYGKSGHFNILIEELLGLSIQAIWNQKKYKKKYKIKDICMIAIQCLDRLEYIHSKDVIHRDIKPLNLTIGKDDPNVIYLIDFGFAHKFRSTKTGKHIRFQNIRKVLGSMRYLSINANKGYEQSRRDDLESLAYMLIYLAKNSLPWIEAEKQDIEKIKKYKLVLRNKIKISSEKLCTELPQKFKEYLNYVKNLEFEQEPNYDFMRKLFLDVLYKNNFTNDLKFSWIINKKVKIGIDTKSMDNKSYDRSVSLNKKKSESSKKRLYNKIKTSLELGKVKIQDGNEKYQKLNLINHENNIIPINIDKKVEIKSSHISPEKVKYVDMKKSFIYKRKKINNIKYIKKEPKIIRKIFLNKLDKTQNKTTFINIKEKNELNQIKNKNLKNNDSSNKINMHYFKNKEMHLCQTSSNNIYRTLKERENSQNNIFKINNNNKKESKMRIINISRNKNMLPKTRIKNNINEYTYNIYKSPQNVLNNNNKRFHLKNISYNNFEENTFKSNGLGFSFESKNNYDINNIKIKSDDKKLNKNYSIKVSNKKRINSSTNLYNNNDMFNEYNYNNINNYNYILLSQNKDRTSFIF